VLERVLTVGGPLRAIRKAQVSLNRGIDVSVSDREALTPL
jgi:hypothetical protein